MSVVVHAKYWKGWDFRTGLLVSFQLPTKGHTIFIHPEMTVLGIQKHLAEVAALLETTSPTTSLP